MKDGPTEMTLPNDTDKKWKNHLVQADARPGPANGRCNTDA